MNHGKKFINVTSEKSFRPAADREESTEFTFRIESEGVYVAKNAMGIERVFKAPSRREAYLKAAEWAQQSPVKKKTPKAPKSWANLNELNQCN